MDLEETFLIACQGIRLLQKKRKRGHRKGDRLTPKKGGWRKGGKIKKEQAAEKKEQHLGRR